MHPHSRYGTEAPDLNISAPADNTIGRKAAVDPAALASAASWRPPTRALNAPTTDAGVLQELLNASATDPALRRMLVDDPIAVLRQRGVTVPAERAGEVAEHIRAHVGSDAAVAAGLEYSRALSGSYVSARWEFPFVVIRLSTAAVRDLTTGMDIASGIAAIIAAVGIETVVVAAVAGAIAGILQIQKAVIARMDNGNGVDLYLWPTGSLASIRSV